MKDCANSYESGCRCIEHAAGLLAHAPDVQAFLIALHEADKDRVRHLAAIPVPVNPAPVYHGDRPQPWEARPARLRRAA